METKNLPPYCGPIVKVIDIKLCYVICNSGSNSIASADEDDYGTY